MLTLLSWAMPVMVVSTSLLDTLLMVLYQKWLHPWRRILAKVFASFTVKFDFNVRRSFIYQLQEEETPVASPMTQGLLQEPQNIVEEEVR